MALSKQKEKKKSYQCRNCLETFEEKEHLKLHEQEIHNIKIFKCLECNVYFNHGTNFYRHKRTFHSNSSGGAISSALAKRRKIDCLESRDAAESRKSIGKKFVCNSCNQTFRRSDHLKDHLKLLQCRYPRIQKYIHHSESTSTKKEMSQINLQGSEEEITDVSDGESEMNADKAVLIETAFQSRLATYRLKNKNQITDPLQYLELNRDGVSNLIRKHLRHSDSLKINMIFECTHTNVVGEHQIRCFKTKNKSLFQESDVENYLSRSFDKLNREMTEHAAKKSGWTVFSVNYLEIRVNKFTPLAGHRFIPLPPEIAVREAVINVQNKDNECFKHAVLSKYLHGDNLHRASKYQNLKHPYDFSCCTFPTPLSEIPVFEKRNKMSINVFGLDSSSKVYPIKIVEKEFEDHIDLLFLRDERGNTHYCYIKNFARLVEWQIHKHVRKLVICKKCFKHYYAGRNGERRMREHRRLCSQHKTTRIDMPREGNNQVKFKNTANETELPITVCADFESVLLPVSGCNINPKMSGGQVTQVHKLMSYCYFVKHNLPAHVARGLPSKPVLYRATTDSDDVGTHFIQEIHRLARRVSEVYKRNEPMLELTKEEKKKHGEAVHCAFCKVNFTSGNYKTRDHDHITGLYRQALCNLCNLKNRKQMVLPIVFHNLSDYDAHHIVRKLGCVKGDIHVIPCTEERFISFTKKIYNISCRFLDSYRFLSESLAKLAEYLPQEQYIETQKYFKNYNIELVTKKCAFPYDYVDSLEKLQIKTLPPKECFYSSLTESHISDHEYENCKNVWKEFEIKNLGEFSDLYLTIDCLLLSDIFYNFRLVCMKHYNLDPAYYYTTPGLSWDAMLKMTGVELELMTDYDTFMTVESGIRGGLTQCTTRHAVANNPYLKNYDPEQETSYIMYKDANNLYAAAMCEPLPYGGFKLVEDFSAMGDILSLDDEGPIGYIFVVDIKYPKYLHNKHSFLPFLPECIAPPGSQYKKLLATLKDKEYYAVHYRALKQAIQHGLVVAKIHSVIEFKQSRWMKKYIDLNTSLRQMAKNEFEMAFFKYMNNAVYGKCMEQIRNRMHIKIISCPKQLETYIKKATFLDRTIYEENLATVHLAKESVVMNKPIYVGQAVLDLSKVIMYEFYYTVMVETYGKRIALLYMDTDSFIMKIICRDFYRDMQKMLKYFDTSNYPIDHPCYSLQNKKVLAKFKDEMAGRIISEFCGLRAKVYALRVLEMVIKKLKGLKKYALRSKIHFEDYLKCLEDTKCVLLTSYYSILSTKHCLTTNKCTKVSLSAYDDKRYIKRCGIKTLPWGHYKIPSLEERRINGNL
jgi:hypothetical protein